MFSLARHGYGSIVHGTRQTVSRLWLRNGTIGMFSTRSPLNEIVPNNDAPPPLSVGILRETYNPWERRAPLTPENVREFLSSRPGAQIVVQPCHFRIFSNQDYQQAGALVQDDLSCCDIILGVKRPRTWPEFHPNKKNPTYLVFSHVIKGQPENMELLQEALERQIPFLDYECILSRVVKEPENAKPPKPQRLVAFGKYAGLAGMLDTWSVLGRRLLLQGFSTPFLNVPPSIYHPDLQHAKDAVTEMGQMIATDGLPAAMDPIIVAMTAPGGNVHQGVREIFDLVPNEMVSVHDLPQVLKEQSRSDQPCYKVYGVAPQMSELYKHIAGQPFERGDFQENPQNYTCLFSRQVAPFISVLMNCVYWDERFPRLLTRQDMQYLYQTQQDRLLVISDISCDVNGSIEFLDHSTTVDQPCYLYDPISGQEVEEGSDLKTITMMAVDILPTELPVESSTHFGNAVMEIMDDFSKANTVSGLDDSLLSPRLYDAMITTSEGKLSPSFHYLDYIMKRTIQQQQGGRPSQEEQGVMIISLEGHLFDSGLINQILDVFEANQCSFEFKECRVRHQPEHPVKSTAILKVTTPLEEHLDVEDVLRKVHSKVRALVDAVENAGATVRRIDRSATTGMNASVAYTESQGDSKTVLLLGSGRVSKSVVDLLGRTKNRKVVVASDNETQAHEVAEYAKDGIAVGLDIVNDQAGLSNLVEQADVVISLLPVPMHPTIAEICINSSTDLVTASYESEGIRKLHQRAKDANVTLLNEVGLDPGLDHMSAMRLIDEIHLRGGRVTTFSSVCGGLPAPEAADNPLKYKFSWSPKGVISASRASAKYLRDDNVVQISGAELLNYAAPFEDAWPDLQLECLPNRDSLSYAKTYGIEDEISTIFRGTLRYRGFSGLMNVYQNMGLFDDKPFPVNVDKKTTWFDLVEMLREARGGFKSLDDFLLACAEEDKEVAKSAQDCLKWLGLMSDRAIGGDTSVLDTFCRLLEEKLCYDRHERDMVLIHHNIAAEFSDGTKEEHHSSLKIFGDRSMTAMCKTVGFTTAAAADLVLTKDLGPGLVLPTEKHIYLPILEAVKQEGIVFDETFEVKEPTDMVV